MAKKPNQTDYKEIEAIRKLMRECEETLKNASLFPTSDVEDKRRSVKQFLELLNWWVRLDEDDKALRGAAAP